jgi:hypothetical protein
MFSHRVLQYQVKAEPVPLGAKERTSIDKWEPATPDLSVRRTLAVLPTMMAFVPLLASVAAPDPFINSQPTEPIAIQSFQYQSLVSSPLPITSSQVTAVYINGPQPTPISFQSFQYDERAEPLKPISTVVETVTADKWLTQWPQPWVKRRRLVQYGVNCAIAEQADDGLPPVHWIPETETPSFA